MADSSPHLTALDSGTNVDNRETRLLCLGKTGSGKSALGNTILGRKEFVSRATSVSITDQCNMGTTKCEDRDILIVDTPGIFDTKTSNELRLWEISQCIAMASPGFHALLLAIEIGRFTEEERNVMKYFEDWFGKNVSKHIIVVFTHKDKIDDDDMTIAEYLEDCDDDLKELLEKCQNRCIAVNNKGKPEEKSKFMKSLMTMVDETVNENDMKYFSNDIFEKAESLQMCRIKERIAKDQERIGKLNERRKRLEERMEDAKRQRNEGQIEISPSEAESLKAKIKAIDEKIAKIMSTDYRNETRQEVLQNPTWFRLLMYIVFTILGKNMRRHGTKQTESRRSAGPDEPCRQDTFFSNLKSENPADIARYASFANIEVSGLKRTTTALIPNSRIGGLFGSGCLAGSIQGSRQSSTAGSVSKTTPTQPPKPPKPPKTQMKNEDTGDRKLPKFPGNFDNN